jgi:hypothetical protein
MCDAYPGLAPAQPCTWCRQALSVLEGDARFCAGCYPRVPRCTYCQARLAGDPRSPQLCPGCADMVGSQAPPPAAPPQPYGGAPSPAYQQQQPYGAYPPQQYPPPPQGYPGYPQQHYPVQGYPVPPHGAYAQQPGYAMPGAPPPPPQGAQPQYIPNSVPPPMAPPQAPPAAPQPAITQSRALPPPPPPAPVAPAQGSGNGGGGNTNIIMLIAGGGPSSCARSGCPCDSFSGNPGDFCSRGCRQGPGCRQRMHVFTGTGTPGPSVGARCVRPGCPCDSFDGSPGQFCSQRCRTSGAPCPQRLHARNAAPGAGGNGGKPSKCHNPACPCDSWDGKPGQFCCRTCSQGIACNSRKHEFKSESSCVVA